MHLLELTYFFMGKGGVKHTTLDPEGPGVVRIHLLPPRFGFDRAPSVVILNGRDILSLKPAWTILLAEFIDQLNNYAGKEEISEEDFRQIKAATVNRMRKFYPRTKPEKFQRDLATLYQALLDVAYGNEPSVEIPYMSIGEYAKYMSAPHRMDLMISSMTRNGCWNCNQKCTNCYAAGQPIADVPELSTEEWKEIIDKCWDARIPQITFTGGEPTLRNDLVELIEHSRRFVTRLNTNGVLLTKPLCEDLRKVSLDSVQITLYSCDKDVHQQLTGAKHFEKTVQGIKNAVEAGLNVSINTPLCQINRDYVKTLEFVRDLGVRYVTCSGIIMTGNALDDNAKKEQLASEELCTILEEAVAFCAKNDMEISFTSPGIISEEKLEEIGLNTPTCGACMSNMAVAPNGDVIPCQSWLNGKSYLGNMLKDPWNRIWKSPVCRFIRLESAKMNHTCPFRERIKEG